MHEKQSGLARCSAVKPLGEGTVCLDLLPAALPEQAESSSHMQV